MTTQTENNTTAASSEPGDNSPFHVLMLPDGQRCDSRMRLDECLVGDYLSKRHEAYRSLSKEKEKDDEAIWSGASTIEKWLIWCCELPQVANEEGDATLPGALRRDRVLKFASYLALYCHDVTSRALAISILERTLEADLPAIHSFEAHQAAMAAASQEKSSNSAETKETDAKPRASIPLEGSPTTRGRKRMIEMAIESPSPTPDDSYMPATLAPPPRKPDRLLRFLSAGGLKILDQWVEDASKPVATSDGGKSKSSAGNATATKESPTGALLLPLLVLLRNLPFNKTLVTQSKINRQIRKLSKDIDAIAENKKSKKGTHPRAGGYPVADVQQALNDLKATWNAQQKMFNDPPPDPLQAVREALEQKLAEVQACRKGDAPAPAWLVKAEESQKLKPPPAKKKRGMSTEEMNRIEHQQERNQLLKENLQKAEQQRRQLLKKLREMKERQEAEGKRQAAAAAVAMTMESSRRRIKWKDGLGHTSKSRKREELEEVFVFLKNSSAASGTVHEDITNETFADGNVDLSNPASGAIQEDALSGAVVDENADDEGLFC